jgi:hypothetical protein
MTTKTGRNQPCPCGSGKKFKQCCLRKEEEAEREAMAALSQARKGLGTSYSDLVETVDTLAAEYEEDVALTNASNAAVNLVRAGKLDEAEQAARDLLVRFPDVHDGYDRLGMVYEGPGRQQTGRAILPPGPRVHSPAPRSVRRFWIGSRLPQAHRQSSTRQPHEVIDHVP